MMFVLDMSMLVHTFHHVRKADDIYDVSERCLHKMESLREWCLDRWECQFFAVFDNPNRMLFRKQLFPEYKEGRTKHEDLPEAEAATLEAVSNDQDWTTVVAREGFEADDEMASLAKQYNGQVIVYSADRDCHSFLESGRVVILKKANVNLETNSLEMTWFSERDLLRKYEIVSDDWAMYQILVGGKDNVPGWHGVGQKKAIELIRSCIDIESIDVDNCKVKLNKTQRENYETFRSHYQILKQVRTIRTDLPWPEGIEKESA